MFVRGVSLVFLIWIAFLFQDSLCHCDRPSWVRVGWEILPEDLEQLQLGTPLQSNCLPYPLDQLSHCFTHLEIAKRCFEVLYVSCKIILFFLGGLCVRCLWSKLRRPQKKVNDVNEQGRNGCTCNVDKMLCRLVANTSIMMKYLKDVCHHHRNKARHQNLSKKRKEEEIKDEEIFPICPASHSSSMDTIMQEV
uniref:Testis expressed 50 n=1 Tax=Chrysemys picta bellii TaxID=8478 RepID=A0A8C3P720_CHRPI